MSGKSLKLYYFVCARWTYKSVMYPHVHLCIPMMINNRSELIKIIKEKKTMYRKKTGVDRYCIDKRFFDKNEKKKKIDLAKLNLSRQRS